MARPNTRAQTRSMIQIIQAARKGLGEAPGAGVASLEGQGQGVLRLLSPIVQGMVDPQAGYEAARAPAQGPVLGPALDRALDSGQTVPDTGLPALVRAGARSLGPSAAYAPLALATGGLANLPQLFAGNAAGTVAGEAARQAGLGPWAQIGANVAADMAVGGLVNMGIRPGTPLPPDIEAQPKPIRDAFDRWSGPEAVYYDPASADVPPMGEPVIVKGYHGTTHDIRRVDPTKFHGEADIGPGFYATSSLDDANENYARVATSADLTNKIERRAEQIADEVMEDPKAFGLDPEDFIDGDIPESEIMDVARREAQKELVGPKEGNVLSTYLRLNKPAYLGSRKGYIDFGLNLDDEGNQIDSEDMAKLAEYLRRAENEFDDFSASDTLTRIFDSGDTEMTPDELVQAIVRDNYAMDDSGNLASGQIAQGALKALGYDSAIRFDPASKWRMNQLQPGDQHYTVFEPGPGNVKATTARGFDPSNPDLEDPAFVPRGGEGGPADTIVAETQFKGRVKALRTAEQEAARKAQLKTKVQLARAAKAQEWEDKVQANRVFPDQPDELQDMGPITKAVPQSNIVRHWLTKKGASPQYREQMAAAEEALQTEGRADWHRALRDANMTEGKAWYNTEPMRQEIGTDEMRKMAAFAARNSAGTTPAKEVQRDLWAYAADRAGKNISELDPYSPDLVFGKIGSRLQNGPWKQGLQEIQDEFRRRAAEGDDMARPFFDPNEQPKFARYAENLSGNADQAPGDYMMARLMYGPVGRDPRSLASDPAWTDVKRPSGGIGDNLSNAELDALEKHTRALAREVDISTGQGQAAIWVGGQHMSELGTDGRTWLGHINVALQQIADRMGVTPSEVWRKVKAGDFTAKELGGLGAVLAPFIGIGFRYQRVKKEDEK